MAPQSDGGTAIAQSAATIARLGGGPTVHERGRVDRGMGVIPISASGRVSLAASHRPRTALERLRWCGCHRRVQGLSAQTPTIPNTRKQASSQARSECRAPPAMPTQPPGARQRHGASASRRGCFTKVTDRKLFVIEPQEPRSASRQINRADPAEALRSSPDAPVYGGSPSRCCLAPMPLVCETASVRTGSEVGVDEGGCSPTRAKARCACRSSRITPAASTPATPAIAAKQGRGPVAHDAAVAGERSVAQVANTGSLGSRAASPAFVLAQAFAAPAFAWLPMSEDSGPGGAAEAAALVLATREFVAKRWRADGGGRQIGAAGVLHRRGGRAALAGSVSVGWWRSNSQLSPPRRQTSDPVGANSREAGRPALI